MTQDLTKSGVVGTRWQAQMEEFLANARVFINLSNRPMQVAERAIAYAALAQACATSALALATANGQGDIATELAAIAKAIIGD